MSAGPNANLIKEAREHADNAEAWMDGEPDTGIRVGPLVYDPTPPPLSPLTEWTAWACQNNYYVRQLIALTRDLADALAATELRERE